MNTVEFVLLIVLSVGFLILIILSIILVSVLIKIMNSLKHIAARAESATSNVAGIAETLSRRLAPLAASGLLGLIMKRFGLKKSKK